MKHRKLFPASSDSTNETTACSDYCDPNCAFNYNCVSLPDIDFYSPPPPPLPHHHYNHSSSTPFVIIFVIFGLGFFLCLAYYVVVYKTGGVCNDGQQQQAQFNAEDDDDDEELFLDENRIDHPIWLIRTVGLQQSLINSITVCKYKEGEGLIEGTECSVCLNEFQEDETVRLLPKCNHAFHLSCIDTWLRSHINCPMCRAHIVVHETVVTAPLAPATANQNSDNSSSLAVAGHSGIDRELEENQETNGGDDCENRTEAEEGERNLKKDKVNAIVKGALQVQPMMRRSVSLDSSLAEMTICLGLVDFFGLVESGEFSRDQTKDTDRFNSNSTIVQSLHHKGPVYMKRSFSSCSGRLLSSRRYRNLNAILPL